MNLNRNFKRILTALAIILWLALIWFFPVYCIAIAIFLFLIIGYNAWVREYLWKIYHKDEK